MNVKFSTLNLTQKMSKSINPAISEEPQAPTTTTTTTPPTTTSAHCTASFGRAAVELGKNFPKKLVPGTKIDGKIADNGFDGTVITPQGRIIVYKDGELLSSGQKRYSRHGDESSVEVRSAQTERLVRSCRINHRNKTVDTAEYDYMGTPTGRTIVHPDRTRESYEYSTYGKPTHITTKYPDGTEKTEEIA